MRRVLQAAPALLLPRARRAPCCRRSAASAAAATRRVAASAAPPAPAPTHKALLIDVGGCLLEPAEPVGDTYIRYASAHGVRGLTRAAVSAGFRAAFATPRPPGAPRYVGDGAAFWRPVVAAATGCADDALFAAVFAHFESPSAWRVAPGAPDALAQLRAAGVRLAVVSNWDTRLRPLLAALQLEPLFDAIIVSAELGVDKPDARVFRAALQALGADVAPAEALMLGDDVANDLEGARAAGCDALLWGRDVTSFAQLADTVLRRSPAAAAQS